MPCDMQKDEISTTTITTNSIKPHIYIYFALCACRAIQNGDIEKKNSWIMSYFIVFRGRFTLSREFKSLFFCVEIEKKNILHKFSFRFLIVTQDKVGEK